MLTEDEMLALLADIRAHPGDRRYLNRIRKAIMVTDFSEYHAFRQALADHLENLGRRMKAAGLFDE